MTASLAAAFVADLRAWMETGEESRLVRALRSPCSGVPHDTAAVYAAVAGRVPPLLDAISRGRIAVPSAERDALLRFAERVRSLTPQSDPASVFELSIDEDATDESSEDALLLLPAVSSDPASGVRARQSHFSASSLNAYAECARKWYYRYVCAAVEDAPSSASTYGTAFHAALEDFHAEFPHPSPDDEAAMRTSVAQHATWAFERYRSQFDTPVELELQRRRALRTAERYVDWVVAESKRAPFTVIGREIAVSLDLEGFAFVGYIDRLDRDDRTGAISIFDYKTGSIATSATEYRDKVRRFADFQLPFYYWAETALGERVFRLALIPLKDALLDVQPVSLEVVLVNGPEPRRSDAVHGTIAVSDLERARSRMIEICRELTGGALTRFPVTNDPSACTYCAYKDACIDRPHEERERFGR